MLHLGIILNISPINILSLISMSENVIKISVYLNTRCISPCGNCIVLIFARAMGKNLIEFKI